MVHAMKASSQKMRQDILSTGKRAFGLSLWAPVSGHMASSTRTEIAAALITLVMPIKINVGIHNKTVVDICNKMAQHIGDKKKIEIRGPDGQKILGHRESPLHRPRPWAKEWKLMRDGDLWENLYNIIEERGPESTSFTKIKAHCDMKDVNEGRTSFADMDGNSEADIAADNGTYWNLLKEKLAVAYKRRQDRYK